MKLESLLEVSPTKEMFLMNVANFSYGLVAEKLLTR